MIHTLRKSINFSLSIAVITAVLAALFSIISTFVLSGVEWALGMLVVLIIVLTGIFFDMLGIAATAANEVPFHAMASEKVKGARHSILITRNADRFASFCNDVIGDISGIISGTASSLVILSFALKFGYQEDSLYHYGITVLFTSGIAALTVGGKAFGKSIAISFSTEIIFQVGRLFYWLEERLKITLIKDPKRSKKNKKKRNPKGE
jgi:CBS domain containing-hemolysin-like protein